MHENTNIFALTKQDTAVLKGIAIMAMLLHHLYGCAPEDDLPFDLVLFFLCGLGKVCVALFLVCSGYGLSVGYEGLTPAPSPDGDGRWAWFLKQYINPWIIGGYGVMGVVMLINIFAMSKGVLQKEVGVIESLSYLFVPCLSRIFFREKLSWIKIIAIAVIMTRVIVFL